MDELDEYLTTDEITETEYYINIHKKELEEVCYIYVCNNCDFLMLTQKEFCPSCYCKKIKRKTKRINQM